MKKLLYASLFGASLLAVAACGNKNSYVVAIPVPEQAKGQEMAIIDALSADRNHPDTLGKQTVSDTIVSIMGKVEKPTLAVAVCGGYPVAQFILEPGEITFTPEGLPRGTKLNDTYSDYAEKQGETIARMNASETDAEFQSIMDNDYVPAAVGFVVDNPASPANSIVFGSVAPYLSPEQVEKCFEADTVLAADPDFQRIRRTALNKKATSAGTRYVDLQVQQEDSTLMRLSDYVKEGQYTLVDFWASWCGPCRKEIPGIIELYGKYKGKGLNVVGVAVWDRPEDTRKAVEALGITYPVIFNGNRETSDVYGVMAIPCVILIGPDGTIIDRDLMGEKLADTVNGIFTK